MYLHFTVSKIGYYTPFILVGATGSAIAAGLMTTLKPSSGAAAWVCYQLLNGAALGLVRQQPITAVQAVVSKDQLAVANSLVTFSQMFGSAVFVSFGQTAFANSLKTSIGKYAPEVDASKVLDVGATDFRSVVPASSVPGVILAYNRALTTTFVSPPLRSLLCVTTNITQVYRCWQCLCYLLGFVWAQMDQYQTKEKA